MRSCIKGAEIERNNVLFGLSKSEGSSGLVELTSQQNLKWEISSHPEMLS